MSFWWLAALLTLPLQIPRPAAAEETARDLHAAYRSILQTETTGLKGLAEGLDRAGDAQAAGSVRARLPRPSTADGPSRFSPLPDVIAPRGTAARNAADPRIDEILSRSATGFFDLAQRAAKANPPRYALAGECLRAVVERKPDHAEARRLARVRPLRRRVGAALRGRAVPQGIHRPPRLRLGQGRLEAAPRARRAAESRRRAAQSPLALRRRGRPAPGRMEAPLADPHRAFRDPDATCRSPRSSASAAGSRPSTTSSWRSWPTSWARTLAPRPPLPRPDASRASPSTKPHLVYYFASRQEYLDYLRPTYGANVERSLGFYDPPKSSRGGAPAYFFRDPDGQLPVTANLYHEVSHQLLFETAGPNALHPECRQLLGFRGAGDLFRDGRAADRRIARGRRPGRAPDGEAIRSMALLGRTIPLEQFVGLDETTFSTTTPPSTCNTSRRWP